MLGAGCAAPAPAPSFPDVDGLPWNRLGLFIGIDAYPRIPEAPLHGCVNDARALRDLFAERYGVARSLLLTDGQATRAGIGEAFRALIAQARIARTKGPVHVVVVYAGHGGYVADDGDDEEDGRDETWVPHDSSLKNAENDIRDDEIAAVLAELLGLGAKVVFISDSCHSGSVHRAASFAGVRGLPRGENAPPGPALRLFAELPAAAEGTLRGRPGLATYAACDDHQTARECVDAEGRSCGRLSYVLRRLLAEAGPEMSGEDLSRRIAAAFASRGFLGGPHGQDPRFDAAPATAREPFFGGAATAPLRTPFAFPDFAVFADPKLPASARGTLEALAREGRLRLAAAGYALAVLPGAGGRLRLCAPEDLETARREVEDGPPLVEALLELALIHGLRSLGGDDARFVARLNVYREAGGSWTRLEPPLEGGQPILRSGDHFTVTLRNGLDVPLYASFVDVDLEGEIPGRARLAGLKPTPREEDKALQPGEEYEYFTDKRWKVDAARHQGRHQLRVLGTSARIDLDPLIAKDGARRAGLPAGPAEYIEAAIKRRGGAPTWTTATVVLRVPPPGNP